MRKYVRLMAFLTKIPWEVCGKIGIGLAMVILSFIQAFCLARGVTAVFDKSPYLVIFRYLAVCMLVLVLRSLLVRYQEGYAKKMAAKVKAVIRNVALEKLMQLGPAYKNDKRTGNLQSLLTDGVEAFEPFLVQYLPQTVVVFCTTLCSALYLWYLDSSVSILILCMAILSVFIPHLFMPAVSRVMIAYWQDYAELNSQYIDSMQGMNTLKSMGASQREGKRLEKKAWKFAAESMKNLNISLSDSAVIVACTTIGAAAGNFLAAYHMVQGYITYESLLMILFFTGECLKPLSDLNTYWHNSYLGLSVAEELFTVLDEPIVIKEGTEFDKKLTNAPKIELQGVTFRYDEKGRDVLEGIDMQFESGKLTAIVGKSGSGKSTIVHLLLRFYDAQKGRIYLNGTDIRDYTTDFLRSQIAVVFQETYLFYGTVRDNLLMANPKACEEELIEAAKAANAHEFIEKLPKGYDTVVGERGASLSGGERQRIAIARAILKNAPILILDEATSSVDMIHESLIQEALKRCMQNKTTIMIAHRLSTIEHADRIYVLDHGKVVGSGTQESLQKENRIYQGLVKAQNSTG